MTEPMPSLHPQRFCSLAHRISWSILFLLGIAPTVAAADADGQPVAEKEQADQSLLTVDRIYGDSEFSGEGFSARWLPGGAGYTRLEPTSGDGGGRDIVHYDAGTGDRQVLVPAARLTPSRARPLAIDDYAWSRDRALLLVYTNSQRVWRQATRGDYWLLDCTSHELRKLGGDAPPASLMFAKLSPTGRHVAFVRAGQVFVEDLLDDTIRQVTPDQPSGVIQGTFDWVYEEELSLRDGFRWSGDGRRIAFWQIDTRGVREFPLVDNTAGLYPSIVKIPYPKVGQQNPACRVGVVDIESRETRWLNIPGDPRQHYIARMDWVGDSSEIILQQLNRLQNTNRVMLADAESGQARTILTERDEAWVEVHDELEWLDQHTEFTWHSERTGWRQLYLVAREGEETRRIATGEFDVISLEHVDSSRRQCYFLASPDDPTSRYLYRAELDGGPAIRVTPEDQPGTHAYDISPGGRWALHTWSSFDDPPRTELIRLPEHKCVRKLAENRQLRKKVRKLRREPTEFFRVEVGDGVALDAWCIKPPEFDPQRKYPLLVYVYGEPAGQTVLNRWSSRGYLWHLLLAQQGYVVMSFDNRGTPAPRGRAWRKCVYRQVGVLAPQDQAAAVRAVLEQRPYLDPQRVGIWGWSGGGSMTLNAIFKFPDLYQAGISVAPVPNQRYYDTIYQERYMGLPQENVEGYANGSPINFAGQLQGNLLLIHGTGDDNCHYQTTELLINELVRLNKPFQMMAYPWRSHGIGEGQNTSRHLRNLMLRFLLEMLPVEN
jgi:dipeptidyl-peptidase-4